MNNNLYSIIVPIYKVENYLKQCIESLINQTYKNIEIILVDDGSPDECPKICDDYAKIDSRIKVLHKTNGGLVSARKAGASISNGDYIICVDGDDFVSINMIEKINEVLEKHKCDVVCSGHFEDNEDRPQQINFASGFYDKKDIIEKIFPFLIEHESGKYFPNNLWSKAFKRELYIAEQNAVDDRIKIGEDLACTKPLISKADSIYILSDCLYFYRTNLTSMTKNKKPFAWEGPELIYNHLIKNIDETDYDFTSQIYRNCVHNVFNVAVSQFYRKDVNSSLVKKEIKEKLFKNNIYKNSIEKAKYKNFKSKLMLFALRKNKFFLMKLYSKLK